MRQARAGYDLARPQSHGGACEVITPAPIPRAAGGDKVKTDRRGWPHLLAYLAAVPDPRGVRGRRHPLVAILAMAAAAVLAGARSIAAIAEWAADAPQPSRAALGARHDAPGCFVVPAEATIRRTLARLDADGLVAGLADAHVRSGR